jgi:chromosome segregation ATPase
MATEFDASEFVDREFEVAQRSFRGSATTMSANPNDASRAPSREEVESQVGDLHNKLTELKRAQTELERERASLEETRRRQQEFTTGRDETIHNLTRGIGLLEEAEFAVRRDAEQMAKTLEGLRDVLGKVQTINDQGWTKENFQIELTRALTAVENARMEWNAARLKWTILSGEAMAKADQAAADEKKPALAEKSFGELVYMGLALTAPLLAGIAALIIVLLLKH